MDYPGILEICAKAKTRDRTCFGDLQTHYPNHPLTLALLQTVFTQCQARNMHQDLVAAFGADFCHPLWEVYVYQPPFKLDDNEEEIIEILYKQMEDYMQSQSSWCCCWFFNAYC